MSTVTVPDTKLAYSIADEQIEAMAEQFLPLVIDDLTDAKALKTVHDARMVVKGKRVEIEKKRVELKADALRYGREVDAEAKRLTGLLLPIEQHLEAEENKVAEEKARVEREKAAAEKAIVDARVKTRSELLAAVGSTAHSYESLAAMSEDYFDAFLAEKREAAEIKQAELAERQRIQAEEDAARKVESERLAAERAELDRIRQEQAAEAARIAAEKKKIADAEAEQQRQAEVKAALKREAEEVAERARVDAERKAQQEAAERERLEALRPDREKLLILADAVMSIERPPLSDAASKAMGQVEDALMAAATAIRKAAQSL